MGSTPVRTCVGCRTKKPQAELVRVARRPDGSVVAAGPTTSDGRGAYVCAVRACVQRAWRTGSLRRALRYDGALPEGLEEELLTRCQS